MKSERISSRVMRSEEEGEIRRNTHERLNLNLNPISVQRVRPRPTASSSVQLQRILIPSNQTRHSRRIPIHRRPNSSEVTCTRSDSSLSRRSSSEVVRIREDGDDGCEEGRLEGFRCWRRSEDCEALEDPFPEHRLSLGQR